MPESDGAAPKNEPKAPSIERLEPEQVDRHNTGSGVRPEDVIGLVDGVNPEDAEENTFTSWTPEKASGLHPVRRTIVFLTIFLIGLIVALVLYQRQSEPVDPADDKDLTRLMSNNAPLEPEAAKQDPTALQSDIYEASIGFVSANTVEERYRFSRKLPGLKAKMEAFYANNQLFWAEIDATKVNIQQPTLIEGIEFFTVIVSWPGVGNVGLALCNTKEGYRVDWGSLEVWQPVSVGDFLDGKIEEDQSIRIEVQPDDFFVSPYQLDDYISVRLTGNSFTQATYGYIKRGSETSEAMREVLNTWRSGDHQAFRMILKLRYIKKVSRSTVVEIVGVDSSSWITPNPEE